MNEDDKAPLTDHLEELRSRLIRCFIAVGIGFGVSYYFSEQIFGILKQPLMVALGTDGKMIFTGLPEAFFTYLKTAFLSGLLLASPVIILEFWLFVSPGLYKKERLVLIPIVFLSIFFFLGGSLFGYFFVFPYGFKFFIGFAGDTIEPMLSMREYLSFASKLLLAFGVIFELPLAITALAKLGIVSVAFLKKNRKYALLLFFVGAAILTPPDVVTQILMAMPLMVLYEISILGAWLFGKKETEEDDADEEKTEADA